MSFLSHAREHWEHEEGARYDDIRERYASEIADIKREAEIEEDYANYMQSVWEAGFGEDADAYEAYCAASLAYADTILGRK